MAKSGSHAAVATWGFAPYPVYKDSRVRWFREIPVHWEVRRLKECATVMPSNVDKKSVEGEVGVRLCNYMDVYHQERIDAQMDFMKATASREQIRRFSLRKGDVLITKDSETPIDIAVPAVVSEDLPGVLCGYHLALIRPRADCVGEFLGHVIGAVGPRSQYHIAANGITRFGLTADAIGTSALPIPPTAEQQAIAGHLDRKTAKIDAVIGRQHELMERLQEKRTTLISHAVTKGLDPDAPMKDSGIEWLGEIPSHWEVRRLKQCASVSLSNVDKKSVESEARIRLCNYVDVYHNERIEQEMDFMMATASADQIRRFSLKEGDVLITKDSETWTDIAVPAVVDQDLPGVLCGYHLALVRSYSDCVGAFLARVISAIGPRDQYHVAANGITRFGLTADAIRSSVLPIPPTAEQQAIADHLDRETAKIDALTTKITESIDLLTEYRTALISAAVTGKIDVRNHRTDTDSPHPSTDETPA